MCESIPALIENYRDVIDLAWLKMGCHQDGNRKIHGAVLQEKS